ncbi:MAG: hypothetical protein QXD03_05550 [Candidatus Anstonellales archaeon]
MSLVVDSSFGGLSINNMVIGSIGDVDIDEDCRILKLFIGEDINNVDRHILKASSNVYIHGGNNKFKVEGCKAYNSLDDEIYNKDSKQFINKLKLIGAYEKVYDKNTGSIDTLYKLKKVLKNGDGENINNMRCLIEFIKGDGLYSAMHNVNIQDYKDLKSEVEGYIDGELYGVQVYHPSNKRIYTSYIKVYKGNKCNVIYSKVVLGLVVFNSITDKCYKYIFDMLKHGCKYSINVRDTIGLTVFNGLCLDDETSLELVNVLKSFGFVLTEGSINFDDIYYAVDIYNNRIIHLIQDGSCYVFLP